MTGMLPGCQVRRHGGLIRRLILIWAMTHVMGWAESTSTPPMEPPWPVFVDVTQQAGIDFSHRFGDDEMTSILEATGPGCAFLDFDGDGDLDIYAVNGTYIAGFNQDSPQKDREHTNRLYRNNGDGTFTDVTQAAGVGHAGYGIGVLVADYDNDGYRDLFLCNFGPNVLYHNQGDGTFEDVTEKAGVAGPEKLNGFRKWSLHGSFFDYDNDGWLDLYVCNYLAFDPDYAYFFGPEGFPGPLAFKGQPDLLYHNNGDGTFSDVTRQAGVYHPSGRGMSVGTADFDHDGDIDLFVANDAMENNLFQNLGGGKFKDVALEMGVAFGAFGEATSSMAPIFEDFDNNGTLDLFVPDMGFSCLYKNDGQLFIETTSASGIAAACGQYTSWAPVVFDVNNDGLRDIFVTNGDPHHLYPEEDLLFRNKGHLVFEDVSLHSGDYFTKSEYVGRGAVFGDYDNDGDVDIFLNNCHGPAVLLRNDGGNRNHWLTLVTQGTTSNRDGIGARVQVQTGSLTQVSHVRSGFGYLSASDMRVYFGLGSHDQVDKLTLQWPGGKTQILQNVKADQILKVKEPE